MNMVILLPHSSCSVHSWVGDVCIAFLWGFMWESNLHLFASRVLYKLWIFGKQRKKSVGKRLCNMIACVIRGLALIIQVVFSNPVFLQACNCGRCQGHCWDKKAQCSSKLEAISGYWLQKIKIQDQDALFCRLQWFYLVLYKSGIQHISIMLRNSLL